LLVNTLIRRMRSRTGKNISRLTPAAMEGFMEYHWPGNIRELKSALEFAFVIAEGEVIDMDQLPPKIVKPPQQFISPDHRLAPGIDHHKTMETRYRFKENIVGALMFIVEADTR
jgi:DNA-binding NtrC family response regulator